MSSVTDIPTAPGELFAKFLTSFYADPVDALFKTLWIESFRWRIAIAIERRALKPSVTMRLSPAEDWFRA